MDEGEIAEIKKKEAIMAGRSGPVASPKGKQKSSMERLPWILTIVGMISGQSGLAEGFTAYDCSNRSNTVESNSLLEPDACAASDKNG
jgi:hypothetical protein